MSLLHGWIRPLTTSAVLSIVNQVKPRIGSIDLSILERETVNSSTDICITVFFGGNKHRIVTRRGGYRNLMALLYDRLYIDDFGECRGIGRCGTCHIYIINHTEDILQRVGNEAATLAKMDSVFPNSRLACQMIIDNALDGLQIEVVSN